MNFDKIRKQVGDTYIDVDGKTCPKQHLDKWLIYEDAKVYAMFILHKLLYIFAEKTKRKLVKLSDILVKRYYEHNNLTETQFSFTFYSFDREIMIEVDEQFTMYYDVNLIDQASLHFKAYLDEKIGTLDKGFEQVIKKYLMKKQGEEIPEGHVKKLLSIGRSVDHPEIERAIELINQAGEKGGKKKKPYYRCKLRNSDTGKYDYLDHSLASIEI